MGRKHLERADTAVSVAALLFISGMFGYQR